MDLYEHKALCPSDPAVGVTRQFYTSSGFAPGTKNLIGAGSSFLNGWIRGILKMRGISMGSSNLGLIIACIICKHLDLNVGVFPLTPFFGRILS